jgi:hypothetical protein
LIITFQSNLFREILEIGVLTRSDIVLQEARTVCILLLHRLTNRDDYDTQYEASCWVDGVTTGTLDEFCCLLKDSSSAINPIFLELVHAWRKASLPSPIPTRQLSVLQIRGLKHLNKASEEFTLLTVQVLTRCLLSSANPVPLAVLILDYADDAIPSNMEDLVEYARALVFYDKFSSATRTVIVIRLLQSTFGGGYPSEWLKASTVTRRKIARKCFNDDCLALTQQMKHVIIIREKDAREHYFLDLLRQLLTVSLMVRNIVDSLTRRVTMIHHLLIGPVPLSFLGVD